VLRKVAKRKGTPRSVLRPDTTLAPVGGGEEAYVGGLPACCLRSFKEAVVRGGEGRSAGHRCLQCGRGWVVTGSLDGRVLGRFAVRGEASGGSGERLPGGSGSAA
jgi:hypothetical protein